MQQAYDLISESVAITRRVGNRIAGGDWLYRLGQVQYYRGQLAAAEANLQETLQSYEEAGNRFGPPGVLSNLALVALDRGDEEAAHHLIQESFSRYRVLYKAARKVGSSNPFEFGDTVDSLLHAGLVAHGLKKWETAIGLFRFVENNRRGYKAIRPLQEKVAAAEADIEARLSPAAFAAAVTEGEGLTIDALLALWLE